MESVPQSPYQNTELEDMLLDGITSLKESERTNAILEFSRWIKSEYIKCNGKDTDHIKEHVFRILQIYITGKTETSILGFIELVDIVLHFPDIFSDRFQLVWSSLDSVICGIITESMIEPIVRVCVPFLLNSRHLGVYCYSNSRAFPKSSKRPSQSVTVASRVRSPPTKWSSLCNSTQWCWTLPTPNFPPAKS